MESRVSDLLILGGGPAGLAAAWYGHRRGMQVTLLEAAPVAGGNVRTIEVDRFRFDTGAHRFHAKDRQVTAEVIALLGEELRQIDVPSAIREDRSYVAFPLDPVDLLRHLGPGAIVRAAGDLLRARLGRLPRSPNFTELSTYRYGASIAERFLLGYTEKLWGVDPAELAPEVSGQRLRGIDLRTFLRLFRRDASGRTRHLDGTFLYPVRGIGTITDRLIDALPEGTIHLGSPVTRISLSGSRIDAVHTPKQTFRPTGSTRVISTLPIDLLGTIVQPPLPTATGHQLERLRFRTLRLALFGIARERISRYASVYFPSRSVPFTRLYESKNRSAAMAPAGRTGIALELPTGPGERWLEATAAEVLGAGRELLAREFGIGPEEILLEREIRLPNAYPVLTLEATRSLASVTDRLQTIDNLSLLGRNQSFRYLHIHDLLRQARELLEQIDTTP